MPEESWTPEEEQSIVNLVPQFRLSEDLPTTGVTVTVMTPPLIVSFPPQPGIPYSPNAQADAATRKGALDLIERQIAERTGGAENDINQWIAGLTNHHRYFALYREAFRRAKARY